MVQAAEREPIPICHGFGCKYKETVTISDQEWAQVKSWFREPAHTPEEERQQIRKATGWLEVIIGRYTPIHLDNGQNELDSSSTVGQLDCIDESHNMVMFLNLMAEEDLFRHHKVVEKAYRKTLMDQHYAGQIEELEKGTRWVVDSWFHPHGRLPYIQESKEWHDISFFGSAYEDNSIE